MNVPLWARGGGGGGGVGSRTAVRAGTAKIPAVGEDVRKTVLVEPDQEVNAYATVEDRNVWAVDNTLYGAAAGNQIISTVY